MEKYQTVGSRFLAALIDSLLAIPVTILAMILANLFNSPKINFVLTIAMSAIPVFYTILMHNFYGQTLGKMAMSVKVLDITETPITFVQAVLRSLPQMLPVFISASFLSHQIIPQMENQFSTRFFEAAVSITQIFYFVWLVGNLISALVTEKKRAFHDFIAGTVVVRTDLWSNL